MKRISIFGIFFLGLLSCSSPPGSAQNPLVFSLPPYNDLLRSQAAIQKLSQWLQKDTKLNFKFIIPNTTEEALELIRSGRTDINFVRLYDYIQIANKNIAEPYLVAVINGLNYHQSQIVSASDSDIKSISQLDHKKIALVGDKSVAGCFVPRYILKKNNVVVKNEILTRAYLHSINSVFKMETDAAATYYIPELNNQVRDARALLIDGHPEITQKIRSIFISDPIPNDPVIFRHGLPAEIVSAVSKSLSEFAKQPSGPNTYEQLFNVSGFQSTLASNYKEIISLVNSVGQDCKKEIKSNSKKQKAHENI